MKYYCSIFLLFVTCTASHIDNQVQMQFAADFINELPIEVVNADKLTYHEPHYVYRLSLFLKNYVSLANILLCIRRLAVCYCMYSIGTAWFVLQNSLQRSNKSSVPGFATIKNSYAYSKFSLEVGKNLALLLITNYIISWFN